MRFKLFNIPVYIHPTFWLFLLFFTGIYRSPTVESLIVGGVMFFSLLVHELGHAITARYFGASPRITLEAFGGYAEYSGGKMSAREHFIITLNGPLFESILIFLPYFLLKADVYAGHPYIQYILHVTMKLNTIWCLLNLIPIVPLDGGKLLTYFLSAKLGARGEKASFVIGLIAACFFIPYLFLKGLSFFAGLLIVMAFQNFQLLKHLNTHYTPFLRYKEGIEAMQRNELEKAKALLQKLLKSKDKKLKNLALESMAKIHHKENDPEKSYALLLRAGPDQLTDGKILLAKLAFERKNYALVTELAHEIYALEPTLETALMNAKAFKQMSDEELATGWLTTASQFGESAQERIQDELASLPKKS